MRIKIVFILIAILASSCSVVRTISLLKSGSVDLEDFNDRIIFDDRANLIIIKVEIKDKFYDFIFDTAAPCAISKKLANLLNLKSEISVNSRDSKGNKSKIAFVHLKSIKLGTVDFKNIGAAIIDFEKIPEMQCLKVDGIIGANLMRNAKWQINYQEKNINFANHLRNLNVSDSSLVVDFSYSISGIPQVDLSLANKLRVKKVKIDTGFKGSLNLPMSIYNKMIAENDNIITVNGYGASSIGAFGTNFDNSRFMKVQNINIDALQLSQIITEFSNDDIAILGNNVLDNYLITLDWETEKIYFEPTNQLEEENSLKTFGFKPIMQDGKLLVGFVFENSPASKKGIDVGNQIISINGINYENISSSQYCNILLDSVDWKYSENIIISWKNSKDIFSTKLTKKDLFIK